MATGYYSLSGVTVAAGGTTLIATHVAAPGAAADPANFVSLVGLAGSEGTPAGFGLLGPAGQVGIVRHAVDATTLQLSKPWVGAAITGGTAELILNINALPIGRLATLITQIIAQRPLLKTNNLVEYAGDAIALAAIATNLGLLPVDGALTRANTIGFAVKGDNKGVGVNLDFSSAAWRTILAGHGFSLKQNPDGSLALIKTADAGTAGGAVTTVQPFSISNAGVLSLLSRPVFNGAVPWDGGNLPVTAFAKTLLDDADAGAARVTLGQKWVTVFDQTVAGSPIYGFNVPLYAFDLYRITLRLRPFFSGGDFLPLWRTSTDGTNFASGAGAYNCSALYQNGASLTQTAAVASTYGVLAGNISDDYTNLSSWVEAFFERGTANASPSMISRSAEFSGTAFAQSLRYGIRAANVPVTHLLIASTVATGFDAGTRLIVEAA